MWHDDGGEVGVGGPALRALPGLLLARAGEVVAADLLVDDFHRAMPDRSADLYAIDAVHEFPFLAPAGPSATRGALRLAGVMGRDVAPR
ncbi:hypothetical protein ABT061_05480 [Streptosporangium sp. NPDC002544]|uniref:hypothetical protein n=1 Tax=Streptosporangium sp. NPDC002544 TaxID=3154538 RepID=UPI00331718DC